MWAVVVLILLLCVCVCVRAFQRTLDLSTCCGCIAVGEVCTVGSVTEKPWTCPKKQGIYLSKIVCIHIHP